MAASILASLTVAGILERAGRRRSLRVTPRFLAHAEGTAGRLRTLGRPTLDEVVLEAALATWDGYHNAACQGAKVLRDLMVEHDQAGSLMPVFPSIEQYAVAV